MKVKDFVKMNKKSINSSSNNNFVKVKYLPFKKKQELVEDVVNSCVLMDNGMFYFDEMQKYITFTIAVIQAYTEIEFDEDFDVAVEEYDMLCEAELLNKIIEAFEVEYNTVLEMLSIKTQSILKYNDINYQFAKFLSNVNDKFDEIIPVFAKAAESMSIDKLGVTQEDIELVKNFLQVM